MSEVVVNRYSDEDLEEFRALIEKKDRRCQESYGGISGGL